MARETDTPVFRLEVVPNSPTPIYFISSVPTFLPLIRFKQKIIVETKENQVIDDDDNQGGQMRL
jgi:hypothetical protein